MAIDLARTSFDPARQYTGVAPQQGRVSLEAEENEERDIAVAQSRSELREIVGVAGTPDDGYAVSQAAGFDIKIGAGTMYVGGLRVSLAEDILYSAQPDWVDAVGDPEFLPVPLGSPAGNEHVILVLREYDVTATEDPVLREVALGGPDGAARTRVVQRVLRLGTDATDCAAALASDEKFWAQQGLTLDPATLELLSSTRLRVDWESPPEPPDPCEPASTGGYLGAENQVIRVQVTDSDVETGRFELVWGWDNASFLYRVTPDAADPPALTLDRQPVDDHHRPRAGQAVELLPAAAELRSTDGVVEGWVAERAGMVGVLAAPYDPDTKTVPFPSSVPAWWTDPEQLPQLYLRVWEQLLTDNELDTDIELPGTGLRVRLTTVDGLPPRVGDHWSIGVRPETPTTVLPARLLRTLQPPDGPRTWVCPLAVIGWDDGELALVDDCRRPFRPLVDLEAVGGGCCTVSVRPSDVTERRLQHIVDEAVAGRPSRDRSRRVTICLQPGRYELDEPLVLEEQHGHLHLEGCGEGVVLAARPGHEKAFAQGLIVLAHADNVRISGIEFELPQVPAVQGSVRPAARELRSFATLSQTFAGLYLSVGIRPLHCAQLEVDRCLFRFRVGDPVTTPENEGTMPRTVFAAGIFAGSECWGMTVEHNRFLHDVERPPDPEQPRPKHVMIGLLVAPSLVYRSSAQSPTARKLPSGSLVRTLLTGAVVRENRFAGISAGVMVFAELGDIRIQDNTVTDCYGGFFLSSLQAQAFVDFTNRYTVQDVHRDTVQTVREALLHATVDPVLLTASVLGRTYPLPAAFDVGGAEQARAERAAKEAAERAGQQEWMRAFIAEAFAPFVVAEEAKKPQRVQFGERIERAAFAEQAATPQQVALRKVHFELSDAERAIAVTPRRQRMRLRCSGNDVHCAFEDDSPTGAALVVWAGGAAEEGEGEQEESGSMSAVLADNRMRANTDGPVAMLLRVAEAVATGNLVHNADPKGASLALLTPTSHAAVTGNLLRGTPLLPVGRPFPPPLDTWLPLNTVE